MEWNWGNLEEAALGEHIEVGQEPVAQENNLNDEVGGRARRGRADEESRKRSALLSFLLRHAPAKYPDFAERQYIGGFFRLDDVMPRVGSRTKREQVIECVNSSHSNRTPHTSRFQLVTIDGVDYIRATYGHTFNIQNGKPLGEKSGPSHKEESKSAVPRLYDLLVATICKNIGDYGEFLSECPDGNVLTSLLEFLKRSRKQPLSTKIVRIFLQPNIEHLDLSGIIVEHGLYNSIVKCRALKSLVLRGCFTAMTDTNLQLILRRCSELRQLDLSACRYITDEGLEHIGRYGKLTHLNLRFLHRISAAAVCKMLTELVPKGLSSVDLSGCVSLTSDPAVWQSIVDAFPTLKLTNSNLLPEEDLKSIIESSTA